MLSVLFLQAQQMYCHICKTKSSRIHACLSCVFFGCYYGQHIQQHAKELQHPLGMGNITVILLKLFFLHFYYLLIIAHILCSV